MLGDIVISVETAARQAEERGHTLLDEIRILLVGVTYFCYSATPPNLAVDVWNGIIRHLNAWVGGLSKDVSLLSNWKFVFSLYFLCYLK